MIDDLHSWALRLREERIRPEDVEFVGPADGMDRSYREIHRVLAELGRSAEGIVYRGSPGYLPSLDELVESDGAKRRIIECAMRSADDRLYILAISCATNVASALLLEPEIARRVVVVWTSVTPHRPEVKPRTIQPRPGPARVSTPLRQWRPTRLPTRRPRRSPAADSRSQRWRRTYGVAARSATTCTTFTPTIRSTISEGSATWLAGPG